MYMYGFVKNGGFTCHQVMAFMGKWGSTGPGEWNELMESSVETWSCLKHHEMRMIHFFQIWCSKIHHLKFRCDLNVEPTAHDPTRQGCSHCVLIVLERQNLIRGWWMRHVGAMHGSFWDIVFPKVSLLDPTLVGSACCLCLLVTALFKFKVYIHFVVG